MKHDLRVENYGVRLRPARLSDAAFIVQLRNSPHAEGFIGDSTTELVSQEEWLKEYFERENDYYFIIERSRDDEPVGTSGVYETLMEALVNGDAG